MASGVVHAVAPGDTLSGIAAYYQVSLDALLALNDLTITSLITPGMTLQLPAGANAAVRTASSAHLVWRHRA